MQRVLGHFGLIISLLFPLLVGAQEPTGGGGGEDYGSEISLHLGHLLPNQIEGVEEILPVYGGRYGYKVGPGFAEAGFANTHAQGVDFTTLSLSLRGDIEPLEHFLAITYVGGDMHYYSPVGTVDRKSAYGGHIGTGLMMHINDTLWARGEMKFSFNPGVSLYIAFGLVFRSKGGAGE